MAEQRKNLEQIEREAVYRMRELFAWGREAILWAVEKEDQDYLHALASLALYPEKPLLSFVEQEPEEAGRKASGVTQGDLDFFRLLGKFRGKSRVRKLITCGGVDDGKSTLIGRIFYDTKAEAEKARIAENPAYLRKDHSIDYALLAGTTEEEASQGITVQVSYGTFAWKGCSFLMADVPGHEEYTHQMAFAASGADTAIIMVAANKGIVPQTRRHTRICHFMGIRNLIFAVNKMDMAAFAQSVFVQLSAEIGQMMEEYGDCYYQIIPVAAKSGIQIVELSPKMAWYQGDTLLEALGRTKERKKPDCACFCMPVQRTCKSSQMKGNEVKKRVIQGEVLSGGIRVGDEIFVYPTARRARVSAIYCLDQRTEGAAANDPIGIELDRELDVARGSILTAEDILATTDRIEADLLWTSDNRLTQGKRYEARVGTAAITAVVTKICYQKEVHTGEHCYAEYLTKNALARCEICFSKQIAVACESESRKLGTILLLERGTHTLAAYGNIVHTITEEAWKEDTRDVDAAERENALGQKAGLLLFSRGEEAKEQMNYVERYLLRMGFHTIRAARDEIDERELSSIRRCLDAGLIVFVLADAKERERVTSLLDEKERVFDCMGLSFLAEEVGGILKKIKRWALELI